MADGGQTPVPGRLSRNVIDSIGGRPHRFAQNAELVLEERRVRASRTCAHISHSGAQPECSRRADKTSCPNLFRRNHLNAYTLSSKLPTYRVSPATAGPEMTHPPVV